MNINLVNEVVKPKKLACVVINSDLNFKQLKEKVEKDKLVKLDGQPLTNVQVWHGENILYSDSLKIKDAHLKDGDTIILKIGPEIAVNKSNPIIKQLSDMGYSDELIRAALFNSQGNAKMALNILVNQGTKGNDTEPNDDDDIDYDDVSYELEKAYEILEKIDNNLYNNVINTDQLKQLFNTRLIDCLNYYQTKLSKSEEETNKVLIEYVNDFLSYMEELKPIKAMIAQINQTPIINSNEQQFINPYHNPNEQSGNNTQPGYGYTYEQGQLQVFNQYDKQAIERLCGFGFEKEIVEQVYLDTGKDENASLDILYEIQENYKN